VIYFPPALLDFYFTQDCKCHDRCLLLWWLRVFALILVSVRRRSNRTVARESAIQGLYVSARGLTF